MKHSATLSLIGGALFLCVAASAGHAAVPGLQSAVPAASHDSTVTKTAWWWHRRRCWWHHHHRVCRY